MAPLRGKYERELCVDAVKSSDFLWHNATSNDIMFLCKTAHRSNGIRDKNSIERAHITF